MFRVESIPSSLYALYPGQKRKQIWKIINAQRWLTKWYFSLLKYEKNDNNISNLFYFSRPDTSFTWFMNPFKSLRYMIWEQYKFCLLKFLVVAMLVAVMVLFFYSMPVSCFHFVSFRFSFLSVFRACCFFFDVVITLYCVCMCEWVCLWVYVCLYVWLFVCVRVSVSLCMYNECFRIAMNLWLLKLFSIAGLHGQEDF